MEYLRNRFLFGNRANAHMLSVPLFRPKDIRCIQALNAVLTRRKISEIQTRKSVLSDFLVLFVRLSTEPTVMN